MRSTKRPGLRIRCGSNSALSARITLTVSGALPHTSIFRFSAAGAVKTQTELHVLDKDRCIGPSDVIDDKSGSNSNVTDPKPAEIAQVCGDMSFEASAAPIFATASAVRFGSNPHRTIT